MNNYASRFLNNVYEPFSSEFCNFISYNADCFSSDILLIKKIRFDKNKSSRLTTVINSLIKKHNKNYYSTIVSDSNGFLIQTPTKGNYTIFNYKLGDLFINIGSKYISISSYYNKTILKNDIINFIMEEYNNIFGKKNNISFYTITRVGGNFLWGVTAFRPIKSEIKKNDQIKDFEYYFDFRHQMTGDDFNKTGILLYGPPGTGKSTMVEYIAGKYGMNVYLVTLCNKDISDTDILKLFMSVPQNSILLFEEFDRQIKKNEENSKSMITIGGILSSLDGPQRLAYNVFTIITTNKKDDLLKHFDNIDGTNSLTRSGRIDKEFEFTQIYK